MIKFKYKAKKRGESAGKAIDGFIEASSLDQAVEILKRRNLVPIKILRVRKPLSVEVAARFINRITLSDIVTFTRSLSTMITAGLPLSEALVILKSQVPAKMVPVVEDILFNIESGGSLADSLAHYPEIFSNVYISFVKAGESAGVLDKVFQKLADNLEKQKEFNGRVKNAMLYPTVIVTGMIVVVFLMMIFVIPKMMGIYKEFGAKLPAPTLFLINVSNFTAKNFPWIVLVLTGGVYGLALLRKTPKGRRQIDELILNLPIFGRLQKLIVLTDVSRTLSLLVGAGVQIVEALNIVSGASSNVVLAEGIKAAAKRVEKGQPLAQAIAQNPFFPAVMPQLLAIGEETGKLDEVLGKIAYYFESESSEILKGLTTAIEPFIMIVLGVGVGLLIVAIIMPIYNLTSQF
jgi:type IV pilus assembly protein PilC